MWALSDRKRLQAESHRWQSIQGERSRCLSFINYSPRGIQFNRLIGGGVKIAAGNLIVLGKICDLQNQSLHCYYCSLRTTAIVWKNYTTQSLLTRVIFAVPMQSDTYNLNNGHFISIQTAKFFRKQSQSNGHHTTTDNDFLPVLLAFSCQFAPRQSILCTALYSSSPLCFSLCTSECLHHMF